MDVQGEEGWVNTASTAGPAVQELWLRKEVTGGAAARSPGRTFLVNKLGGRTPAKRLWGIWRSAGGCDVRGASGRDCGTWVEAGECKGRSHRGAWVAQSVKLPTSAQVTISRFVGSSPACVLQILCPAFSAPPSLMLSLCLSEVNKNIKKREREMRS